MTRSRTLLALAAALLSTGPVLASDVAVRVPDTAAAARAAHVIDRARQALLDSDAQISELWIFPTGEPNTVFVHYRRAGTSPVSAAGMPVTTEHLALIEMRGERIARVHDFSAKSPEALLQADAKARRAPAATVTAKTLEPGS